MKFDIPIIATVEAKTIEEARKMIYASLENVAFVFKDTELFMADDSDTDNLNNRVIYLHPEDKSSDWNPEV